MIVECLVSKYVTYSQAQIKRQSGCKMIKLVINQAYVSKNALGIQSIEHKVSRGFMLVDNELSARSKTNVIFM